MLRKRSNIVAGALFIFLLAVPAAAEAKKDKIAPDAFTVTMPDPTSAPPPANGSIFQGSYVALTSGARAGQVGDILTIQLVERTVASKSNSAGTNRDGSFGLTPPTTGPLSLFNPSDVAAGGTQQFKGKGDAAQSNMLSGEVTVTVAAVYPNGTMLVKGEKLITLNRGDERVQIAGLVRSADVSPDNRVLSTRVANAHIRYTGKGEIARASQQGWLQRFFSIISPF
ncbi:flagellar basal body L-ring protein FlgH [Sphingopyxis sp. KK2]|uniref:flagellar basal body L-ring protein FlgH n=1 Tax=Sphingopyxis sp. KK2 TaxID=1855727 RepID=UPI00097E596D|nr:flagellar basal body L-ring protein FlgH [Sphingopyxis sp. KK2]